MADGDTIDVQTNQGEITVRLAGINTPDRGECYAEEARDHLIETLEGEAVLLEVFETDQFGRTLAHVFEGDRHVNLELVEMGVAIGNGLDDDPYGVDLRVAEDSAFHARLGLWDPRSCGTEADLPGAVLQPLSSQIDPAGPDDEYLDEEFVVIFNDGSDPIDLSGWILRDESTRHRYRFANGTTLGSGASIAISSADPNWDPGGSPVWNNDGDMALLQLPDGTVVDRWRY